MQSSIQLWSLRLAIDEHGWDRAIDSVAESGFRNVEPFALDRTAELVRPAITRNALSVPTAHGFLDADVIDATLTSAAALGVGTVFHPHLDESHWRSAATIEAAADLLNVAAERARSYGIQVGFHNHDHELRSEVDGVPAFDLLLGSISEDVQIEFDINWATVARIEPLPVLSRLSGRLNAVHVKDGKRLGTNKDQRALGAGELDLDGFIGALPEHTLIVLSLDDFDGSSDDVGAAIRTSRAWLDARGVS